ncbi:MAG TPA: L,D-transpeptidase family protein [Acidimicrobiales bacterium]|nr:L,D-transpeptidase family protein [Acidimicrobiales bacterium]
MAPAHRKTKGREGGARWSAFRILAVTAAAAVVVAGGAVTAVELTNHGGRSDQLTGTRSDQRHDSGSAAVANGGSSGSGSRSHGSPATTTKPTTPPAPLTISKVTPAAQATGVATDQSIAISFSHRVAAGSPHPTLTPTVLGRWHRRGRSLVFRPTAGYLPATKISVAVSPDTKTIENGQTVKLGKAYHTSFTIGTGSVLRLQQLLAELGYLPLNFVPSGQSHSSSRGDSTAALVRSTGLAREPQTADKVSTNPAAGHFAWKYGNVPAGLSQQWQPGTYNLITKGAVMAFEGNTGMAQYGWADGVAGPQVWAALLKAVAERHTDPRPYNFIQVNEEGTEYLKVWQDGRYVYQTLANTGVPGAATAQGVFPVASHLPSNWMTGNDVDGTHYHVQVFFAAYFNGGDAIHAYPRASYGYPQSNGCVEVPYANAQQLYNSGEDWYGTLVDVS